MAELGKLNLLRVARQATPGFYLEGGDLGDILLPFKLAPSGIDVGSEVNVFLHRDSEDRLLATTERPKAMVGEFAALRVVSVTPGLGAFLDWGSLSARWMCACSRAIVWSPMCFSMRSRTAF